MTQTFYKYLDQTNFIVRLLLNYRFKKQGLVCGFDMVEVALDSVELSTIRHFKDVYDVYSPKVQLLIIFLLNAEINEENRETFASKLHWGDERSRRRPQCWNYEVNEATILTDRSEKQQNFYVHFWVFNLDPVSLVGRVLGVELLNLNTDASKHAILVCIYDSIWMRSALPIEDWEEVAFVEINFALNPLDTIEPYLLLEVDSTDIRLRSWPHRSFSE